MAKAKIAEFSKEEIDAARVAKALGHPARVRILSILADRNRCITGTLVDALPLAQSTVSQHLKELKDAGLIEGEVEGANTCYCVTESTLSRLRTAMCTLMLEEE